MNLWFRLLRVLLTGFFKKRLELLDSSRLGFRVCVHDLDIYAHMNNGRYLTLMDLGRIDLILRSPLKAAVKNNRWNPLVASILMRYRRSLKLFDPLILSTRVVCWDEKWFYIEQKFEKNGELMAAGLVKGLFAGPEGVIPTARVLEAAGTPAESPPMPPKIRQWIDADKTV